MHMHAYIMHTLEIRVKIVKSFFRRTLQISGCEVRTTYLFLQIPETLQYDPSKYTYLITITYLDNITIPYLFVSSD